MKRLVTPSLLCFNLDFVITSVIKICNLTQENTCAQHPTKILELMMIHTQGKANVRMDQASLFVVSKRALGGSVTP